MLRVKLGWDQGPCVRTFEGHDALDRVSALYPEIFKGDTTLLAMLHRAAEANKLAKGTIGLGTFVFKVTA